MLHLLFQSPITEAVLVRVAAGDDLVFMDNAVLGLQQIHLQPQLGQMLASNGLYVLAEHLTSRGIAAEALLLGIHITDYAGLVELTVKHPTIHSWT
jgi:tRNA 2-thiouridine synthesizing protein B